MYINRTKVKVSYCTCANVKSHICKHNAKILNKEETTTDEEMCKCRNKNECPVPGNCEVKSVVYEASVQIPNMEIKTYIGMTKNKFKTRYGQLKSALKNKESPQATALSKYVWEMRDQGKTTIINWRKIKSKAYPFSSAGCQCDLCISEKREILYAKKRTSLNKRDELLSMCRHRRAFTLGAFKPRTQRNPAIT